MGSSITSHFRNMSDEQFEDMFKLGAKGMSERLQMLEKQLHRCETEKKRFQALYNRLQTDFTNS